MNLKLGNFQFQFGKKSAPTARGQFFPASYTYQNQLNRSVADFYDACSIIGSCLRVYQMRFWEPELKLYKGGKELYNERIQQLLDQPNPAQSQSEFMASLVSYLVGFGNAFIVKVRNGRKLIQEYWVYGSDSFEVKLGSNGLPVYTLFKYGGDREVIPMEDLIHIRMPILDYRNPYLGRSPILIAAKEAEIDAELTAFLKAYIRNGGSPTAWAQLSSDFNDSNAEELKQLRRDYKESHAGEGAGNLLISPGIEKFEPLAPPIKDFQTDKLRYFSEARICGIMGVPPELAQLALGKEQSTYNNVSTLIANFTVGELIPLWKAVQRKLTLGIAREVLPDVDLEFDLSQVEALRIRRSEEMLNYKQTLYDYQTAYKLGNIDREAAIAGVQYQMPVSDDEAAMMFPLNNELPTAPLVVTPNGIQQGVNVNG